MNRIKAVIKERGYTITTLAEKMGMARESLSRIIVSPSYPTLEKLSFYLNAPIWEFFASKEDILGEQNNIVSSKCPHCGKPITIKTTIE